MTMHFGIFCLSTKITVSLSSLMVILMPLQMFASNAGIVVRLFLTLKSIRLLQGDRLRKRECCAKSEIIRA